MSSSFDPARTQPPPKAADAIPSISEGPRGQGFRLYRDAWHRLVLVDAQGAEHTGVRPIRAYPISDPGRWVSLCDTKGHELAFLEDLGAVSTATRGLVEEELKRREFMPTVLRIVRIDGNTSPVEWEVETDRGMVRFLLGDEDAVRVFGRHRVLIVDIHGIRYHIPDSRQLDAVGQRALERYL
ncbi:MAG: DUF1854 domain-containing protein [Thermoguttaceae bacterium]